MELKLILQIVGFTLGLLYLWLEYRANIYLWLVGLVMPVVHGTLYFQTGLYADFGMNVYYFLASVYGWLVWRNAPKTEKGGGILAFVVSFSQFVDNVKTRGYQSF